MYWWFLFFCAILIPIIMIISGRFMWKNPPKNINGMVGYRTKMSMKNMDTWKFAHEYCGKLWWKVGWIMLIPSVVVHIFTYGISEDAMGNVEIVLLLIQTVVLVGTIVPVEKELRKNFKMDGSRR